MIYALVVVVLFAVALLLYLAFGTWEAPR